MTISFSNPELPLISPYRSISSDVALIIDNGSNQCRVGWANESLPSLIFDNVLQKYQAKSTNSVQFALGSNAVPQGSSRQQSRTAYDQNIPFQFEVIELTLDGIFQQLGINNYPIDHPIIMTEPVCLPGASRNLMSELLFEGYGFPKVSYGVDALFSYVKNQRPTDAGIVLSMGNYTTHLLPIVENKVELSHIKRLGLGEYHMVDYMLRLIQAKYPHFPSKLSWNQTQDVMRAFSYVSQDYQEELKAFERLEVLSKKTIRIQFPYVETAASTAEKSKEELEKLEEKRKLFSTRMKQQVEQQRLKKLAIAEEEVSALENMKERKSLYEYEEDFIDMVKAYGYKSEKDLYDTLEESRQKLEKLKNKIAGIEEPVKEKEAPACDLIEIPDSELNEEQIKEKRKQKMMKTQYEAREKMRAEKEEERKRVEEKAIEEEKKRAEDPELWIQSKRQRREEILKELKTRQRLKESLSDRRSQATSARIKSLALLSGGNEPQEPTAGPNKKRKSNINSTTQASRTNPDELNEEGFGDEESDWAIYRELNNLDSSKKAEELILMNEDGSMPTESEEEILENELRNIEESLEMYDEGWSEELRKLKRPNLWMAFRGEGHNNLTKDAVNLNENFESFNIEEDACLVDSEDILSGERKDIGKILKDLPIEHETTSWSEYYQLSVNVERIRVPEALFQPSSLLGIEGAGLSEWILSALDRYTKYPSSSSILTDKMTKNIFLTGGNSFYKGLSERLDRDLRSGRPVQSPLNIHKSNHILDPWKGAALWSNSSSPSSSYQFPVLTYMTKDDYMELGPDRLHHQYSSFFYIPTSK